MYYLSGSFHEYITSNSLNGTTRLKNRTRKEKAQTRK